MPFVPDVREQVVVATVEDVCDELLGLYGYLVKCFTAKIFPQEQELSKKVLYALSTSSF